MASIVQVGRKSCVIYGNSGTGCACLTSVDVMRPLKHSVAVLIRRDDDRILAIRRPDNDDELPGVWGLPAGTARGAETADDVIARIGRDKLGVQLRPIRRLVSGVQERTTYRLEMELWEVSMEGTPTYPEWKWAVFEVLRPGMEAGSLCCELAINSTGRAC